MPLFNYECENCGKKFEEFVMSSSEKVSCPNCKSEKVKKQLPTRLCSAGSDEGANAGGGGCG